MANNIPDYMRGFDTTDDWGFTPVSKAPSENNTPSIDPSVIDNQTLEVAKVKEDVKDIKSMMSEIMQGKTQRAVNTVAHGIVSMTFVPL